MDIEKLIEQFKQFEFVAYNYNINGEVLGMDCTEFECIMADAATALSTLQAENSQLRADLEYEREHANAYYEECGQRAITDQKSDFENGLERVIRVYTADGNIIAEYEGIIDIEGNDGGYVMFDYQGKRYTYYNCFVESIAEI